MQFGSQRYSFSEPADSNKKTKGESLEFATPTIEGTIMADDTGLWKNEKTFNAEPMLLLT